MKTTVTKLEYMVGDVVRVIDPNHPLFVVVVSPVKWAGFDGQVGQWKYYLEDGAFYYANEIEMFEI